ncbi:hypothetical protein BD779DRAFT_1567424 [Infundibulicybe gibba]|nr:hypothetical protein BD779DRAFT_1567424 [Infundibulicybe gibba]
MLLEQSMGILASCAPGFPRQIFLMDFFRLLEDALVDVRTTNYLVAASATVIIFDHIITIEQEVALIWRRPWNMTSLLYNRYYALISLV